MIRQRARVLRAALGFLSLPPREPELRLLHSWLDSWPGIGHVVAEMARQEYDLELRRYDARGWRAMFFQSSFEHSLTSHAGAAWARSPWEAVQRARQAMLYTSLRAASVLRVTARWRTSHLRDGRRCAESGASVAA